MDSIRKGRVALALVGNPGVGKSTLLNGRARRAVFKSGVSIGTGLTTKFESSDANGLLLFDTPGLADIDRRKEAGREIDIMLSQPVDTKICFVIAIRSGGIPKSDAMTVDTLLSAIQGDVDKRFGVIVNQVTQEIDYELRDPVTRQKLEESLSKKFKTKHWLYVPKERTIEDEEDSMLISHNLDAFFDRLPVTKRYDMQVLPVDTKTVEEKLLLHEERIDAISRAHEQEILQMTDHHQQQLKELNRRYVQLQEESKCIMEKKRALELGRGGDNTRNPEVFTPLRTDTQKPTSMPFHARRSPTSKSEVSSEYVPMDTSEPGSGYRRLSKDHYGEPEAEPEELDDLHKRSSTGAYDIEQADCGRRMEERGTREVHGKSIKSQAKSTAESGEGGGYQGDTNRPPNRREVSSEHAASVVSTERDNKNNVKDQSKKSREKSAGAQTPCKISNAKSSEFQVANFAMQMGRRRSEEFGQQDKVDNEEENIERWSTSSKTCKCSDRTTDRSKMNTSASREMLVHDTNNLRERDYRKPGAGASEPYDFPRFASDTVQTSAKDRSESPDVSPVWPDARHSRSTEGHTCRKCGHICERCSRRKCSK